MIISRSSLVSDYANYESTIEEIPTAISNKIDDIKQIKEENKAPIFFDNLQEYIRNLLEENRIIDKTGTLVKALPPVHFLPQESLNELRQELAHIHHFKDEKYNFKSSTLELLQFIQANLSPYIDSFVLIGSSVNNFILTRWIRELFLRLEIELNEQLLEKIISSIVKPISDIDIRVNLNHSILSFENENSLEKNSEGFKRQLDFLINSYIRGKTHNKKFSFLKNTPKLAAPGETFVLYQIRTENQLKVDLTFTQGLAHPFFSTNEIHINLNPLVKNEKINSRLITASQTFWPELLAKVLREVDIINPLQSDILTFPILLTRLVKGETCRQSLPHYTLIEHYFSLLRSETLPFHLQKKYENKPNIVPYIIIRQLLHCIKTHLSQNYISSFFLCFTMCTYLENSLEYSPIAYKIWKSFSKIHLNKLSVTESERLFQSIGKHIEKKELTFSQASACLFLHFYLLDCEEQLPYGNFILAKKNHLGMPHLQINYQSEFEASSLLLPFSPEQALKAITQLPSKTQTQLQTFFKPQLATMLFQSRSSFQYQRIALEEIQKQLEVLLSNASSFIFAFRFWIVLDLKNYFKPLDFFIRIDAADAFQLVKTLIELPNLPQEYRFFFQSLALVIKQPTNEQEWNISLFAAALKSHFTELVSYGWDFYRIHIKNSDLSYEQIQYSILPLFFLCRNFEQAFELFREYQNNIEDKSPYLLELLLLSVKEKNSTYNQLIKDKILLWKNSHSSFVNTSSSAILLLICCLKEIENEPRKSYQTWESQYIKDIWRHLPPKYLSKYINFLLNLLAKVDKPKREVLYSVLASLKLNETQKLHLRKLIKQNDPDSVLLIQTHSYHFLAESEKLPAFNTHLEEHLETSTNTLQSPPTIVAKSESCHQLLLESENQLIEQMLLSQECDLENSHLKVIKKNLKHLFETHSLALFNKKALYHLLKKVVNKFHAITNVSWILSYSSALSTKNCHSLLKKASQHLITLDFENSTDIVWQAIDEILKYSASQKELQNIQLKKISVNCLKALRKLFDQKIVTTKSIEKARKKLLQVNSTVWISCLQKTSKKELRNWFNFFLENKICFSVPLAVQKKFFKQLAKAYTNDSIIKSVLILSNESLINVSLSITQLNCLNDDASSLSLEKIFNFCYAQLNDLENSAQLCEFMTQFTQILLEAQYFCVDESILEKIRAVLDICIDYSLKVPNKESNFDVIFHNLNAIYIYKKNYFGVLELYDQYPTADLAPLRSLFFKLCHEPVAANIKILLSQRHTFMKILSGIYPSLIETGIDTLCTDQKFEEALQLLHGYEMIGNIWDRVMNKIWKEGSYENRASARNYFRFFCKHQKINLIKCKALLTPEGEEILSTGKFLKQKKWFEKNSSAVKQFQKCIQNGNWREATHLMEQGLSPNLELPNGELPLHFAVKNKQVEIIVELLNFGALAESKDEQSLTALDYALQMNDTKCITTLLNYYENDFKKKSEEIQTLIRSKKTEEYINKIHEKIKNLLAIKPIPLKNSLHWQAYYKNIYLKITHKANVYDDQGMLPIHYAILGCHAENVRSLLNILNRSKDYKTRDQESLLHLAVLSGSTSIFHMVLDFTENVNYENSEHLTALHYAVTLEHAEIVESLIKAGAKLFSERIGSSPYLILSHLAFKRDKLNLNTRSISTLAIYTLFLINSLLQIEETHKDLLNYLLTVGLCYRKSNNHSLLILLAIYASFSYLYPEYGSIGFNLMRASSTFISTAYIAMQAFPTIKNCYNNWRYRKVRVLMKACEFGLNIAMVAQSSLLILPSFLRSIGKENAISWLINPQEAITFSNFRKPITSTPLLTPTPAPHTHLIPLNPLTFEQYREEYALKKFHHCVRLTPQFSNMCLKLRECIMRHDIPEMYRCSYKF